MAQISVPAKWVDWPDKKKARSPRVIGPSCARHWV